jgi:epoxyqueuosine reductase
VDLAGRLRGAGLAAGLHDVRFAAATPFADTRRHIEERKAAGLFGRMKFTTARPEISCDPGQTVPGARSLVTGAFGYWAPDEAPPADMAFPGQIARFSWTDWYEGLRVGLAAVATLLEGEGFSARVLVDANQLVDRAAAERSGIGWFGKNTNVLHPRLGSWVLLGSVITDAVLPPDPPSTGTCGSCVRCLPACPTGALIAPGVLDARVCISYLLQAEGDIPVEMRSAVGTRLYGCDDCQDVCPPNRTAVRHGHGGREGLSGTGPVGEALERHVDLAWVVTAPAADLLARFGRFYIPRRDVRYLRRNALVALGNSGDPAAIPLLAEVAAGDDAMLSEHAVWAIARIGGADSSGPPTPSATTS